VKALRRSRGAHSNAAMAACAAAHMFLAGSSCTAHAHRCAARALIGASLLRINMRALLCKTSSGSKHSAGAMGRRKRQRRRRNERALAKWRNAWHGSMADSTLLRSANIVRKAGGRRASEEEKRQNVVNKQRILSKMSGGMVIEARKKNGQRKSVA